MKYKWYLLAGLPFVMHILMGFEALQAQAPGEVYRNTEFFEDFDGPLDDQVWQVLTGHEHGGDLSAERCYTENGMLHLIFINDSATGYLSSAIQTRDEFLYGRWEASLKPSDVPGVLNSFYTIDWNNTSDSTSESNGTKQEADIEFLSKSFRDREGEVHLALHASGKKSVQTNPDIRLDFNPSADFHVWGFEITPDYIEWFVDDSVLQRYTYSEHEIALDAPYMLKLNFWSSEQWIGGPPEENAECVYLIDWIRFTPLQVLRME